MNNPDLERFKATCSIRRSQCDMDQLLTKGWAPLIQKSKTIAYAFFDGQHLVLSPAVAEGKTVVLVPQFENVLFATSSPFMYPAMTGHLSEAADGLSSALASAGYILAGDKENPLLIDPLSGTKTPYEVHYYPYAAVVVAKKG